MKPDIFVCLCALAAATLLTSCKDGCTGDPPNPDPRDIPTDYSDAGNWLYVAPVAAKPVDVFFACPTTYYGEESYCAVTDQAMRAVAAGIRVSQATVYEQSANLFMPHYRQLNAVHALTLSADKLDELVREVPARDMVAAFKHYLDHYSGGRPFILAGHSQGSQTLLNVLEYIKSEPELLDRFVCAYLIGYSVTQGFLDANPPLKFATGAADPGTIVSWNTESPGLTVANPVVTPGALVINPISWTRTETRADESLSLGARLETSPGVFQKTDHYADAQLDLARGVVVCSTVDPEDYAIPLPVFPVGVLHGCDYSFYYYDLQQNVADRTAAYLAAQP